MASEGTATVCQKVCTATGHNRRKCIAKHDGSDDAITKNKREHFHTGWSIIGNEGCKWKSVESDATPSKESQK